jgi:type I restriction enzyme S subunit
MQRLLSGKVRFPEFVKTNDKRKTRFGDYPKDWAYKRIQEVATQVKDKVGDHSDGYTVMSCTKHEGLVSSLDYFDRQVFSKDISKYKAVKNGEFAYATNHIEEGSIGYNDWCEKGAISPMYTVFKADAKRIDNDYLFAVVKTENYRRIFEIFTNGTVNRRGSLRWKDFKKIKVPVPSLAEQRAISTFLKAVDREIDLLEMKLVKHQKQKKGLMQQLLTGTVRVNNLEAV